MEKVQSCELDDSIVVYQYIKLEYLIKNLASHQIVFNRISKWEDVYENYAFKELFQLKDGTPIHADDKMRNRLYGQCLTAAGESDAMWRIYSHLKTSVNDSAVRVSTTIGKIRTALKDQNYDIRPIIYLPQVEIEKFTPLRVQDLESFFRNSSFYKRIEFIHEQEIRVVIENESHTDDLLPIHDISLGFYDEYVLDPRLTGEQEATIKEMLELEEVSPDKIRKSELYKFNVKTIKISD